MTSLTAVVNEPSLHENDRHRRVRVFAGPDPGHRAHCGELTMLDDEADDLSLRLLVTEDVSLDEVTPKVAAHVLYVLGLEREYDDPPDPFTHRLVDIMLKAGRGNFLKLSLGFPAYARAIVLYKDDEDGVERLRTIARG